MIEDAEYKDLLRLQNKGLIKNSSQSALLPLKGRKLDSCTSYGVLETVAKWLPNLKYGSSLTSSGTFLMEHSFLLKFQIYQHDELAYLNDAKGYMITPVPTQSNLYH